VFLINSRLLLFNDPVANELTQTTGPYLPRLQGEFAEFFKQHFPIAYVF